MHPNAYLRTFWRTEFRPQVFVAMSFAEQFQERFVGVIEPAIQSVHFGGRQLKAVRVDLSQSGDSILTDIVDGVAHSALVLADVSVVGYDSKTGTPYRNGNVMYEVGIALAARQPAEVLLIRDDRFPFLFDVSTVPHMHLDFSDRDSARAQLTDQLKARLREIAHARDARLAIAKDSLTAGERGILAAFRTFPMGQEFGLGNWNLGTLASVPRLLDKGLLRVAGITEAGQELFTWTTLGKTLADLIDHLVPVRAAQQVKASVNKT